MTVKIRPYRRGGLEVDIMIRMPLGARQKWTTSALEK